MLAVRRLLGTAAQQPRRQSGALVRACERHGFLMAARQLSAAAGGTGLPSHIKFRMPDLDFSAIGSGGKEGASLSKWYIREGQEIKDGAQMCEIDTPDLNFVLESGDEGFIARILVQEGSSNLVAGQTLAVIVPEASDIETFLHALKENPNAIEGYTEGSAQERTKDGESPLASTSLTENAAGSDVLRVLHKLQKEGRIEDEKLFKVLKSLARKNDPELLTTFRGSFEDGVMEEAAFDKDFFVENALDLAEEASKEGSQGAADGKKE